MKAASHGRAQTTVVQFRDGFSKLVGTIREDLWCNIRDLTSVTFEPVTNDTLLSLRPADKSIRNLTSYMNL